MDNLEPLIEMIAILTRKAAEVQSDGVHESGFSELSLRQIFYLDSIARAEHPTPSELARLWKITRPSVTASIDKLAGMGLIRKVSSDDDRRSYHLHLTGKGRELAEAHHGVHRRMAEELIKGLEPHEITQLMALITKMSGKMQA